MKFSQRIRRNCFFSNLRHGAALAVEGWLLLSILVAPVVFYLDAPVSWPLSLSDAVILLLLLAVLLAMALGLWKLMGYSLRRIRANTLPAVLQELGPGAESRLRQVEDLPARDVRGVDLRFDDAYVAVARRREIAILPLKDVRYFFDYGIGSNWYTRQVVMHLPQGRLLTFQVRSTLEADQVIRELYEKTAFGKWMTAGELNHSYAPFSYSLGGHWDGGLEYDGATLTLRDRRSGSWEGPASELESCWLYHVPDGDGNDDNCLRLTLLGGRVLEIRADTMSTCFRLYLQLCNCAPQLQYRFPRTNP